MRRRAPITCRFLPFPSELIGTLPHILTIIALVGVVGRAKPPAALGVPYEESAV